jgi:hypothetical protein
MVAVVLVAGKAEGYAYLFHHRGTVIVLAALALVTSLLRPQPLVVAGAAAALTALAVGAHPLWLGFAVGVAAFMAFLVLVVAIGTALHAWHDHRHPGRLRR